MVETWRTWAIIALTLVICILRITEMLLKNQKAKDVISIIMLFGFMALFCIIEPKLATLISVYSTTSLDRWLYYVIHICFYIVITTTALKINCQKNKKD